MLAEHSTQMTIAVPKVRPWGPLIFGTFSLLLLGWGFLHRHDRTLSAETGLGYWLGILGVSCMLLLLLYPLAKRTRLLQRLVAVRHWFRVHMMLGILGPMAILFHANFEMGSLNSSVALICMLLVVLSGLVGRYFYSKVHLGLYGQKASSKLLLQHARQQQQQLRFSFAEYPELLDKLDHLYRHMLPANPEQLSLLGAVLASPRRWYFRNSFSRAVSRQANVGAKKMWHQSQRTLFSYLDTLRKLAQLQLFERLLSWWHILHLPFFVMMIFTAVIHVWAVHVY